MSLAKIAAVNCVALTKVVVRGLPFHAIEEVETNFVPVTVRVKAGPPAGALEGEREVAVGTGLLTVKATVLEVPPPGEEFTTVTGTVLPMAMSLAKIAAFNCVALTKVVVRGLPAHSTVEPETKFVPVTVSVKAAAPAVRTRGRKRSGRGYRVVDRKSGSVRSTASRCRIGHYNGVGSCGSLVARAQRDG